jgi:ribosomal protein S12
MGGGQEGKTMTYTVMVDVVGVQADSPDDAIQKVAAVLLERHWDIDFYATIQTDN